MQNVPPSMDIKAGELCRRLTVLNAWLDGMRLAVCGLDPNANQHVTDPFLLAVMQSMEATSNVGGVNPPWRGGFCPAPRGDE